MDHIEVVDKLRTTFVIYATIVGVLSFYLMVQYLLGRAKLRKGAFWLILAIWLQTFGDMAELYSRLGTPMTWRTPSYYIVYTILMVGLVKLSISTLPWKNEHENSIL